MSESSQTENSTLLPIARDIASGASAESHTCCSGMCMMRQVVWTTVALCAVLATLVLGYFLGTQRQTAHTTQWAIPETVDATAAVSSEKFSMATGPVGDEAEGLFVLDHNSGLLQCTVMYPRIGQFLGLFTVNVSDALAAGGKGGSYLMITGRADFPRASNRPIGANTLVYVLNTATGNFAAYAIPFDRTKGTANVGQQGTLILMGSGQANPVVSRDAVP